jgi:hypothetical protein
MDGPLMQFFLTCDFEVIASYNLDCSGFTDDLYGLFLSHCPVEEVGH